MEFPCLGRDATNVPRSLYAPDSYSSCSERLCSLNSSRSPAGDCTSTYFDVTEDNGRIVLTPVRINRADAVRAKLAGPGMTEDDVAGAVASARDGAKSTG